MNTFFYRPSRAWLGSISLSQGRNNAKRCTNIEAGDSFCNAFQIADDIEVEHRPYAETESKNKEEGMMR